MRRDEVLRVAGNINTVTLWTWCKDGKFPEPVVLNPGAGRRYVAWRSSEVQAWIDSRPRGKGVPIPQPHLEARRQAKLAAIEAEAGCEFDYALMAEQLRQRLRERRAA
jgi:predicted DNA-binding transcriptional regulator AlpA